jgi:hypothetical protein
MLRIYKLSNNGTIIVATDCLESADFMRVLPGAIIRYLEVAQKLDATREGIPEGAPIPSDLEHDMPQILESAFEILLKLRGYKSDSVGEQRLLFHGAGGTLPPVEEGKEFAEID